MSILMLSRAPAASQGGGGETDPYPWYPSFDLNRIDWHVGAGNWGDQVPFEAPEAPTITRTVNITSLSQLLTERETPGTHLNIQSGATGFGPTTEFGIDVTDIEITVPADVELGTVGFTSSRCYMHGTTPGQYCGYRVAQIRPNNFFGSPATDIVIDGAAIVGSPASRGAEFANPLRAEANRIAIIHCRVVSASYVALIDWSHAFFGNCNMFAGADTRANCMAQIGGAGEGWCIRAYNGPIVAVDCRFETPRYHVIRTQPTPESADRAIEAYFNCDVVAPAEGKGMWCMNNLDHSATPGLGTIIEGCRIYGYSVCGGAHEINLDDNLWSRIDDNEFFNDGNDVNYSQSYLNANDAAAPGGSSQHTNSGNTFNASWAYPAWGGVGDPRELTLPSPYGYNVGEDSCTAISGADV